MFEERKLVVVGPGGVGKSCVTLQFVHYLWDESEEHDPTIEDQYRKQQVIDGKTYYLNILDTAGQDEFSTLQDMYYQYGEGFLCVFSLCDRDTFLEIHDKIEKIRRAKDMDNVPIVLCGNKSDMAFGSARKVSSSEAGDYAKSQGALELKDATYRRISTLRIPYIETSAKNRVNIDEVLRETNRLRPVDEKKEQEKRRRHFQKMCAIL